MTAATASRFAILRPLAERDLGARVLILATALTGLGSGARRRLDLSSPPTVPTPTLTPTPTGGPA